MKPGFDGKTDAGHLKGLPETPGVYFFLGDVDEILYIGKATSLRDRVRSYFSSDILETRGPKIGKMLALARSVAWQATDSVLEALILESRLIREYQPPYNTDSKDDKSYNHVVITEEDFPRVLLVRGRDLAEGRFTHPIRSLFGPFPHGMQLREAMKIVRKIFPYRDKCEPWNKERESPARIATRAPRSVSGRACFHRQIGLCPGVCTGEISAHEYGRLVRRIELFFEGKKAEVVKRLEREMRTAARKLEFEKAGELRNTIFALGHIQDVSLLSDESRAPGDGTRGVRAEAYDVAHLAGKSSVGVMTVCRGEVPEKDGYRKFLLRGEHFGNDLTALEEILRRRLRHAPSTSVESEVRRAGSWPKPDIVVVDGSFLQLGVADRLLAEAGWGDVRLVGVVKNRKHQPERLIGDRIAIAEHRRAILLANAEAHRFALGYHRKRRGREFLKK